MVTRSSLGDAYPIDKLGNVVEFLDNMRRPVTESERISGPYPYYGANGIQGTISDFIFDEPLVLLAEDGGHFDNPDRGIAYRVSGRTWVNNHAHVLRPRRNIDINYLCRVLENYDVKPFVTGTTRGKLTKGGASEIPIPLPPLPEQRRIAAVLDKADALRARRRESLAQLDELTQSIFIEMFGDPVTNPKGWPKQTLGELTEKITDGEHLNPDFSEFGMPIIMAGNVLEDSVDIFGAKKVTEALGDRFRVKCKPELGDLLMVSRGATIGRMCAVKTLEAFCLMGSVILIKVKKDKVNTDFVASLLKYPDMRRTLYKTSGSSAQQAIYLKDLKNLSCMIPPLEYQQHFSERMTVVSAQKKLQQNKLAELGSLFSSLQHRAFRGEL